MDSLDFGPDILCLVDTIANLVALGRDPGDASRVQGAARSRQLEFHAGRNIARIALREFGFHREALPIKKNRTPRWPAGIVGSISHSASHVGVALSRSDVLSSLGFDMEPLWTVEKSLVPYLLLDSESDIIAANNCDPTLYFCCKESVFKASYVQTEEYFEFTDVEVFFEGSSFSAQSVNRRLSSVRQIDSGQGLWKKHRSHFVSLYQIPTELVCSCPEL